MSAIIKDDELATNYIFRGQYQLHPSHRKQTPCLRNTVSPDFLLLICVQVVE